MTEHEHDHKHEHEHETAAEPTYEIRVTSGTTDNAVVLSCAYLIKPRDNNKTGAVLKNALAEFAAEVENRGGFIGHIKATLNTETVEVISITDSASADIQAVSAGPASAGGTAIIFGLPEVQARELLRETLRRKTT